MAFWSRTKQGNEVKSLDILAHVLSGSKAKAGNAKLESAEVLLRDVAFYSAAMLKRADGASSIPYHYERVKGRGTEYTEDMLKGVQISIKSLVFCIALDWLGSGGSYLLAIRNRSGYVRKIRHITHTSITESGLLTDNGYEWLRRDLGMGTVQYYEPDESGMYINRRDPNLVLLPLYAPSPYVEIGNGIAPAKAAKVDANTLRYISSFLADYFGDGAVSKTIAAAKEAPASTDEKDRIKNWLNRTLRNQPASDIPVLRGEWEFHQLVRALKELSIPEISSGRAEAICVALGTPMAMLTGDATNRGDDDNVKKAWLEDTVIPQVDLIYEALNAYLPDLIGYKIVNDNQNMAIFQADEKPRLEMWAMMVDRGIAGDVAAENAGLPNPEKYAAAQPPVDEILVDEQPQPFSAEQVEEAPTRSQSWHNDAKALRNWIKNRGHDIDVDQFNSNHLSRADKLAIAADMIPAAPATKAADRHPNDKILQKHEREMQGAILDTFGRIVSTLTRNITDSNAEEIAARADDDATWQPLLDILTDHLERVAIAGSEVGRDQIERQVYGVKQIDMSLLFAWDIANEAAAAWALGYAGELITGIRATTVPKVRRYVSEWIQNGEPIGTLISRIQDSYLYGASRAQSIAVTEVTRAFAEGNKAAWKESSVVEGKGWQTSNDELVCPICGPLDGKVVGIDDDFGDGIESPPAHPRCRCWIVPSVKVPNGVNIS